MIDVYSIGTTLRLHDLVTPQLLKLSEQFAKVDALALQVNKRLKAMGAEVVGMKNLAAAAGKLDLGLKGVKDQALIAEKAMGSLKGSLPSGIGIERELIAANAEAVRLEARLAGMRWNRVPGGGGMFPPLPPGPGGGGGAGGGGRRHGPHGGNLHVGSGGFGVGGVGMGLADSAMIPLAAGFAAAYVGHAFYESAKEYQDEFMRFKSLNLGDKVNDEADKFVKATKTFGVSQSELMKAMAESVGLFGSFDEASKYTPALVSLGKANAGIFGDKLGAMDEEGLKNLLKFIDRRGGFKNEETFQRNLNLAEKMVTGSGGFLKFQDLGTFSQNAGTAFRSLSDEGLLHMEGLMIEQGGQKAGTALMSLYQNLVAGRTPIKTMHLLEDLGIGRTVEHVTGTVGGKKSTSTSFELSPEYAPMIQADPAQFFGAVLPGLLAKKGIKSESGILKAVNDILSNRNASNQGSIMTAQEFQVLRDYKLAKGAMGANDVMKMYEGSASGAEKDFAAAWADFKNQFGKTMLPTITNMLKVGTAALRSIGQPVDEAKLDKAIKNDPSVQSGRWGKLGDMLGWNGNSHSSSSVPSGSSKDSGVVHTTINIDGRKVAQAVTPYISGPLGSGLYAGGVDNTVSLPMPGLK
ncbi:hypothetical protein SAMN05443245_5253 [Paraburkholderia fungorum]|uniref:Uncharacterized protein n=1 Tax=Paraburkholderia fungorum TaxID=134537 RepID=A0A1H1IJ89_9BURK|nr:hypothetical protein [Paraburkholderia fungorum]SDR37684.1 hypothetical protein SAMN05443245_5253 [Paraburkholderia fungorum]